MKNEPEQQAFGTVSPVPGAVLVFAPHPDDESLGCGGVLALHARAGARVRVVFLTDGGAGENKDAYAEYAATRQAEAEAACRVLGVAQVDFWNASDRRLVLNDALVMAIANLIRDERPAVVYAPSPLDLNPDHKTAAHAVWKALQQAGTNCELWFWESSTPLRPTRLVDISAVRAQKEDAIGCYASQLAVRDYREMILALNRYRALTADDGSTHCEAFWACHVPEETQGSIAAAAVSMTSLQYADPGWHVDTSAAVVLYCAGPVAQLRDVQQSLAAQWVAPAQVVAVCPDSDAIAAEMKGFSSELPLQIIVMPEGSNRAQAWNLGLQSVTTDAVLLLDETCLLSPDHLAMLLDAHARGEADVVYSAYEEVLCTRAADGSLKEETRSPQCPVLTKDAVFSTSLPPLATALLPTAWLRESGGVDETLSSADVQDLWCRVCLENTVALCREATCAWRGEDALAFALAEGCREELRQKYGAQITAEMDKAWQARQLVARARAMETELAEYRALAQTRGFKCLQWVRRLFGR